jgi:hypothetical protein
MPEFGKTSYVTFPDEVEKMREQRNQYIPLPLGCPAKRAGEAPSSTVHGAKWVTGVRDILNTI